MGFNAIPTRDNKFDTIVRGENTAKRITKVSRNRLRKKTPRTFTAGGSSMWFSFPCNSFNLEMHLKPDHELTSRKYILFQHLH